MSRTDRLSWHVVGETVQGAAHVKRHIPNRDNIFIWTPDNSGVGPPLVLTISDGRGSARCCRSDLGSKFLVKIASRLLQNFADSSPTLNNQSILIDSNQKLGKAIVLNWQKAIEKHLAQNKLRPEEIARVGIAAGKSAQRAITTDPALAYGATLLGVLLTETYALYLKFGTGDLISVDRNGNPTAIFPTFGAEPKADQADAYSQLTQSQIVEVLINPLWQDLQIRLVPFANYMPDMILAATDGYANSFKTELEFRKIAPDYLHLLEKEGIGSLINKLDLILTETSRQGSGDDITLGLIKSFIEEDIDLEASAQTELAQNLAALDQEIGLTQTQSATQNENNRRKSAIDILSQQLNELADEEGDPDK